MDRNFPTTLMLRLALVTYNENPSTQTYFHVNQLEYHADDVHKLNDGTGCVPLSDREIEGKKKKHRFIVFFLFIQILMTQNFLFQTATSCHY